VNVCLKWGELVHPFFLLKNGKKTMMVAELGKLIGNGITQDIPI